MRIFTLALCWSCCLLSNFFAQDKFQISPQDKAYLFHSVKKSPILDQNLGRFFEYRGEEIKLPNGTLNYDSIELMIVNQPNLLHIHTSEIGKSPKGLVAEMASKHAVWQLNKVLQAKRANELAQLGYVEDYDRFELLLVEKLPKNAFNTLKGETEIHTKVTSVLNPSLTFQDKLATLNALALLTANDKKEIIDAVSYATNKWVEERSYAIFKFLGGNADFYSNVITAAGNGSSTSDLFVEREKDERGRWTDGVPKAIGLFSYQTEIFHDPKRSRESVRPEIFSIHQFDTPGKNRKTNIHLDVWGYNTDKQTTVVIERLGKVYPLFGSSDTRFLSPDSTFGDGLTYYTLINRLQKEINDLEEMVSGRRGFDYWIDYHEKRKQGKLLQIDKTEKLLSDMRMSPIRTNDKKYKTKSGKKKRKKNQERVVRYYEELSMIKRKILELEKLKEEALLLQNNKIQQQNKMLDLIGRKWVPFTVKDGFYTFEDSVTFDMYTQEFTIPATKESEVFEIRLLAIPTSLESDQADEVMVHINVTDATHFYDARLQLELVDVFESDKYVLSNPLLSQDDSLAVRMLFEALLEKKKPFNTIIRGGGIGEWNGFQTVKDDSPEVLTSYPGRTNEEQSSAKKDSSFIRLRCAQVFVQIGREIHLEVNSFNDPVASIFSGASELVRYKQASFRLSNNDLLTAYRSKEIALKLNMELNTLAKAYLSKDESEVVIDRLNKQIDESRIIVGQTSFLIKDF